MAGNTTLRAVIIAQYMQISSEYFQKDDKKKETENETRKKKKKRSPRTVEHETLLTRKGTLSA